MHLFCSNAEELLRYYWRSCPENHGLPGKIYLFHPTSLFVQQQVVPYLQRFDEIICSLNIVTAKKVTLHTSTLLWSASSLSVWYKEVAIWIVSGINFLWCSSSIFFLIFRPWLKYKITIVIWNLLLF